MSEPKRKPGRPSVSIMKHRRIVYYDDVTKSLMERLLAEHGVGPSELFRRAVRLLAKDSGVETPDEHA